MLNSPLHNAYRNKSTALWVCPSDISSLLRSMRYAEPVRIELSEWISRLMSMAFVAGRKGVAPPVISRDHIRRLLDRMGYCAPNAQEIEDFVFNDLPGLYNKGKSLANAQL